MLILQMEELNLRNIKLCVPNYPDRVFQDRKRTEAGHLSESQWGGGLWEEETTCSVWSARSGIPLISVSPFHTIVWLIH